LPQSGCNYTECAIGVASVRVAIIDAWRAQRAGACTKIRTPARAIRRWQPARCGTKLGGFAIASLATLTEEEPTMISLSAIDDVAKRLAELVPPDARAARDDLVANFRDVLRSGLRRLDLVTREEFDAQRGVLLRTREMVEALEARVAELEERLR